MKVADLEEGMQVICGAIVGTVVKYGASWMIAWDDGFDEIVNDTTPSLKASKPLEQTDGS